MGWNKDKKGNKRKKNNEKDDGTNKKRKENPKDDWTGDTWYDGKTHTNESKWTSGSMGYPSGPGFLIFSKVPSASPKAAKEACEELNWICSESENRTESNTTQTIDAAIKAEIEELEENDKNASFKSYKEEPARGLTYIRRTKSGNGVLPSDVLKKLRAKDDINFKWLVKIVPLDHVSPARLEVFSEMVAEELPKALKPFGDKAEWNMKYHCRNMEAMKNSQAEFLEIFKKNMPSTNCLSGSAPDIMITVQVTYLFAAFSVTSADIAEKEFHI